ncbi:MAG: hypothetical protein KIT72_11260 [Polyangiaceae bacterium]|nr:hypothetical protein [Polyangiaceae bacterium]MCW5790990.1 hypothetical protein [Polyangiaceae bacterium]
MRRSALESALGSWVERLQDDPCARQLGHERPGMEGHSEPVLGPPGEGERGATQDLEHRAPLEGEPLGEALGSASDGLRFPLDPLQRALARTPLEVTPSRNLSSLDPRWMELVQRVAWGRQGSQSTLRLELGGKLRGGVLLLQGDDRGSVKVSLELPPGEHAEPWRERLAARLSERRIQLEELEVR